MTHDEIRLTWADPAILVWLYFHDIMEFHGIPGPFLSGLTSYLGLRHDVIVAILVGEI